MKVYLYPSILIISLLFITGCATSFKQNWHDFTAYYNTFYNAKQYYNEGLENNQRQRPEINPEVPVRIHLPPSNIGAEDFGRAIEKSADILRRHNQSSYVDQAIEMIGKSYYYRGEYFAAMEKFQELFNTTSEERMKQKAIIWEGRTYLEMEIQEEGSRVLEARLESSSIEWEAELRAEARAILAQHYVKQEDWEKAAVVLNEALEHLEGSEKKARGYFLYGQLMEWTGDLKSSYAAFREVLNHRPYYELEYYAGYKEADIFRQMGFYHTAYDLFRAMERDDKHFGRRPDLLYELAKTEVMRENPEEAERLFNRVLRYRVTNPRPLILAKSYYSLAEIYKDLRQDFNMTAAYYDSAAMQRVDPYLLPSGWNANELAGSFGEYVEVSQQIARMDSLLELGSMEPSELDSALARIREQHQRDLIRQEERQQELITFDQESAEGTTEASGSIYGFLNSNDQAILERSSLQFRARWGDRPLADNWRRREAVSGSRRDLNEQQVVVRPEELTEEATGFNDPQIEPDIDIGAIPFTRAEQDSMVSEKFNKIYQLGNVFLLNLNMPDSARVYFNRVVSGEGVNDPNLKPRALYALAEINLSGGNPEEAERLMDVLHENYPGSPVSNRILEGASTTNPQSEGVEREAPDPSEFFRNEPVSSSERAQKLHRLALVEPESEYAPMLLYEAAREYIKAGREESVDEGIRMEAWQRERAKWEEEKNDFFAKQDSANSKVMDTTLTEEERVYWNEVADSTLPEPDFTNAFPYHGTEWDSARSVLHHLDSLYSNSEENSKANYLRQELSFPTVAEDSNQ